VQLLHYKHDSASAKKFLLYGFSMSDSVGDHALTGNTAQDGSSWSDPWKGEAPKTIHEYWKFVLS